MPTAEANKENKTTFSKGVRGMLWGLELHSWEQIMLGSLLAAGVIAIAVFVTTACVVILTRRENVATKVEYESYKLLVEGKVADAKKEGIEAGKMAGNALLRAAEFENRAAEATERAEQAKVTGKSFPQ